MEWIEINGEMRFCTGSWHDRGRNPTCGSPTLPRIWVKEGARHTGLTDWPWSEREYSFEMRRISNRPICLAFGSSHLVANPMGEVFGDG